MHRQVQWSFLCLFPLPFSNIQHAWPHFPSWSTLLTLLWESTPLIFFALHQPLLPSSFGRPPRLCSVSKCWDRPGLCLGTLVLHGFSLAISSSPMALNTGNVDDSRNFISRIDLCHELQAWIPSSPLVWHLKLGMSQTVLSIPLYLPSVFPILVPSCSSPKPNVTFVSFHYFTPIYNLLASPISSTFKTCPNSIHLSSSQPPPR